MHLTVKILPLTQHKLTAIAVSVTLLCSWNNEDPVNLDKANNSSAMLNISMSPLIQSFTAVLEYTLHSFSALWEIISVKLGKNFKSQEP